MAVKKRKKSRFEFLTRKFPLRMQRKLVMLFMAVVLAFVVLIVRITYINVTKGSKYIKVVLDQQNYDSRVITLYTRSLVAIFVPLRSTISPLLKAITLLS